MDEVKWLFVCIIALVAAGCIGSVINTYTEKECLVTYAKTDRPVADIQALCRGK